VAKAVATSPPIALDQLDRQLLIYLQGDARASTAALARRFKLSGPGLQKRLKKLETRGVIRRYATIVRREAVGLDLLCYDVDMDDRAHTSGAQLVALLARVLDGEPVRAAP